MLMPPTYKVIAVVVTHNRIHQLKQIVEGLRQQTYSLHEIIIVDNDSKDGTGEWLATQNDLIAIHQENSGGAGGFHTGVKTALEQNADRIWLLDDDVLPEKNCLEALLSYADISKCVQPVRLTQGDVMLWEERFLNVHTASIVSANNISFQNGKEYITTNTGCFEGMLIASEIVKKIGLPDERFFLAHDDLVYGYLASKYTNIVVTNKAVLHKLPSSFAKYDSLSYLYYSMRNLWLVNEYLSKDFPETNNYRKRHILFQFFKRVKEILFTDHYENKTNALRILAKAYTDYKKHKIGNTFNA